MSLITRYLASARCYIPLITKGRITEIWKNIQIYGQQLFPKERQYKRRSNADGIGIYIVNNNKKSSKHSIFSNLYGAANINITMPQSLYNVSSHLFELRSSGKHHYIIKIGLQYFLMTKHLGFNILFMTTTAPTMNFLIRNCKF